MIRYLVFLGPLLLLSATLSGQPYLTSITSIWSDEWYEWVLYGEEEDQEGTLQLRFPSRRDYTEWTYTIDNKRGSIQPKWPDRFDEWELRAGDGTIVTARALWRNDPREWRLTDGTQQLTFKTRFGNRWDEWELRDDRHGRYRVYTSFENDIREWVVEDELDEGISFGLRLLMVYIAVYHSLPLE